MSELWIFVLQNWVGLLHNRLANQNTHNKLKLIEKKIAWADRLEMHQSNLVLLIIEK